MAAPTRTIFIEKLCRDHFNREIGTPYRTPCYHLNVLLKKLKHHEHNRDPFYCSVYDYNHGNQIPYKKRSPSYSYNYTENVILDKIFFDFDKDYNPAAKKEIEHNRVTLGSKREFILTLLEHGRIKEPIDQAMDTARYLQENYGGDPFLVFSGSKGCHLYYFFEPVHLEHPKESLTKFTRDLRDKGLFYFNTDTELGLLDTAPVGDVARISRVPGSIHPETGLYCHPFKMDHSYGDIISNSQEEDPPYTDFNPVEMRSPSLGAVLMEYDNRVKVEMELLKYQRAFKELEPRQPPRPGGEKVKIRGPEDILKLNHFPCFKGAPYDHNLRVILSSLCLWSGLSPEDTATALKIFSENKEGYDPGKHLHDPKMIRRLMRGEDPQYVFTCKSLKRLNICRECNQWFYLKLDLPEKYYNLIKDYGKAPGGGRI